MILVNNEEIIIPLKKAKTFKFLIYYKQKKLS